MAKTNSTTRLLLIVGVPAVLGVAAWILWARSDDVPRVELGAVVQSGQAAGFNVLLVTMDTTRPDRLGCYGYAAARTPAIDSLVAHGVRFDDAVSSAPTTLPSHATILTGLNPISTGVHDNGRYRLAPQFTTLAEVLHEQGYATAAFVASFVLDRRFGLAQGFDVYDFDVDPNKTVGAASYEHDRRASSVTHAAARWLGAHHKENPKQPFFAWVHYYDPHLPYDSPLAAASAHDIHPYDAEIAFVDRSIRRLLDQLDKLELRERTLIVFVTDHGESLGDHGENAHGVFVYEATIRVGLIVSNPRLFPAAGRVDQRVVGTVDIFPTVLDLLGVGVPSGLDGLSLLAQPEPDRAVYFETYYPVNMRCAALYGLRRHADKLIRAPRPEYYDLASDPKEARNLFSETSVAVQTLSKRLDESLSRETPGASPAQRGLTNEERQQLEALGYVTARVSSGAAVEPVDPKDRIELLTELERGWSLVLEKRYEEALAVARPIAAEADGWDGPVLLVAEVLMLLERRDELVEALSAYCERHPSAEMIYYLAHALFEVERFEECARTLDAAELLDPNFGAVPALRGELLLAQGAFAEAATQFEHALAIDGERLGTDVREMLASARRQQASPIDTP